MKTIVPFIAAFQKHVFVRLLAVVVLLSSAPTAKAGSTSLQYRDSIVVSKALISKKYKVKIYPGANNEVLFFNASGEDGKVYQFFLFDMEGNMVKQTQIRNKQTTILTNFNKGCYTFEVFSDDEHIENGTLTIK